MTGEVAATLTSMMHKGATNSGPSLCVEVGKSAGFKAGQSMAGSIGWQEECAATLSAQCSGTEPSVCYAVEGNTIDRASNKNGKGYCENVSPTLNTQDRHGVCFAPNGNHCGACEESSVAATLQTKYHYGSGGDAATVVYSIENHPAASRVRIDESGPCQTLTSRMGTGGGNVPMVMHEQKALCVGNGQLHQMSMAEQANTLDCMHDQQAVLTEGKPPRRYIIRRLTPLECCRLQGFPDWWEDGVEGGDSARYKMWGNGVSLPCASDVLRRVAKCLKTE